MYREQSDLKSSKGDLNEMILQQNPSWLLYSFFECHWGVFAQSCSSVPPADPGTSSRVHRTRHHTVRSVRQLRRQRGHITARGVPQRARFRERHLPKGGNIQFSREMSYIFNKTTLGRLQHVWMEHLNISLYTHREGFFSFKNLKVWNESI